MSTIKCKGCTHFRQRIACSTLSGRPLLITQIRADDEEPGLRDFEGSFLRLIESLTNGCQVSQDNAPHSPFSLLPRPSSHHHPPPPPPHPMYRLRSMKQVQCCVILQVSSRVDVFLTTAGHQDPLDGS